MGTAIPRSYQDFQPQTEIIQGEGSDMLVIYLYEFRKDQLKVQIDKFRRLMISGERPLGDNKWSRFRKDVQIPTNVNTDDVSAKFDNGVLRLVMPKIITKDEKQESGITIPQAPPSQKPAPNPKPTPTPRAPPSQKPDIKPKPTPTPQAPQSQKPDIKPKPTPQAPQSQKPDIKPKPTPTPTPTSQAPPSQKPVIPKPPPPPSQKPPALIAPPRQESTTEPKPTPTSQAPSSQKPATEPKPTPMSQVPSSQKPAAEPKPTPTSQAAQSQEPMTSPIPQAPPRRKPIVEPESTPTPRAPLSRKPVMEPKLSPSLTQKLASESKSDNAEDDIYSVNKQMYSKSNESADREDSKNIDAREMKDDSIDNVSNGGGGTMRNFKKEILGFSMELRKSRRRTIVNVAAAMVVVGVAVGVYATYTRGMLPWKS